MLHGSVSGGGGGEERAARGEAKGDGKSGSKGAGDSDEAESAITAGGANKGEEVGRQHGPLVQEVGRGSPGPRWQSIPPKESGT